MHVTNYVTAATLRDKCEEWLGETEEYRRTQPVDVTKTALLVIDMQRVFLESEGALFNPSGATILPQVKRLAEAARKMSMPVLYTAQGHVSRKLDRGLLAEWWDTDILEEEERSEIHPSLRPNPGEKVIWKRRYSGFFQTDLDLTLRCLGIESVIITGVQTNVCCESTARDAFYRDYRVLFTADATATINEDLHLGSLKTISFAFGTVVSTSEVVGLLRGDVERSGNRSKIDFPGHM